MENNAIEMVLTPYEVNGLELFIDPNNGSVYASQRGLAKICGKARSTIQYWIAAENISNQRVKASTSKGLQVVEAFNEETIAQALEKYNPRLLIQCQKAGLRVFLHGLVGVKYEAKLVDEGKSANDRPRALKAAEYSREIMDLLGEANPRIAQYLVDKCVNEVIGDQELDEKKDDKASGLTPSSERLLGVVEIAESMGFSCNISTRVLLGKYVASLCRHLAKTEKRLCNGRLTDILVYPNNEVIREVVKNFFE